MKPYMTDLREQSVFCSRISVFLSTLSASAWSRLSGGVAGLATTQSSGPQIGSQCLCLCLQRRL